MAQCFFKDSGLIHEQGDTEANYQNESWFDPGIHDTCDITYTFPSDWRAYAYMYIPNAGIIESNFISVADDKPIHPLWKALANEFSIDFEDLEDKVEAAGGFKALIENMDIDRLARRVKKLYQNGDITLAVVNKLKKIFGHLTSELNGG